MPRKCYNAGAPRGLGDLGRMVIYFQGAGSTGNYFQVFGKQAHSFGDLIFISFDFLF